MPEGTLKDILISARQEAARLQHHFLGVEHLFLGLLRHDAPHYDNLLAHHGFTVNYICSTLYRIVGKGSKRRLWEGHPYSPRAQVVINIAHDIAIDCGREGDVRADDILTAIAEEGESIPVRTFKKLGLNVNILQQPIAQHTPPTIITEDNIQLTDIEYNLIARLFADAHTAQVYAHNGANLYLDVELDTQTAYCMIIGDDQRIIEHALRQPKRERCVIVNGSGAYAYHLPTEIATSRQRTAQFMLNDLTEALQERHDSLIALMNYELSHRYEANFTLWQHLDWHLPPLLTLQAATADDTVTHISVIDHYAQLGTQDMDVTISLNSMTVYQVRDDAIHLSVNDLQHPQIVGHVVLMPSPDTFHYRGEPLTDITGRIFDTRFRQIRQTLNTMQPDFNIDRETIPVDEDGITDLPNPLYHYTTWLNQPLTGHLSFTTHGNLTLDTIGYRYDIKNQPAAYDYVTLGLDIQHKFVAPLVGDTWDDARYLLRYLLRLYRNENLTPGKTDLIAALQPLKNLLEGYKRLYDKPITTDRVYMGVLAIIALGQSLDEQYTLGHRRTAYMLSAMAMYFAYKNGTAPS